MFYIQDIQKGLSEIVRVLRKNGVFYCSTSGREHMREITDIVKSYDSRIELSQNKLYDAFGLENGEGILKKYFSSVQLKLYDDELIVDQSQPLVDYIMSCHGNQSEVIGTRLSEFQQYIEELIDKHGSIRITKQAGVFICLF